MSGKRYTAARGALDKPSVLNVVNSGRRASGHEHSPLSVATWPMRIPFCAHQEGDVGKQVFIGVLVDALTLFLHYKS